MAQWGGGGRITKAGAGLGERTPRLSLNSHEALRELCVSGKEQGVAASGLGLYATSNPPP